MGVPSDDTEKVARLVGLKTIVNEFAAYQRLGEMKAAKQITERAEAIATFALCGFANPVNRLLLVVVLLNLKYNKDCSYLFIKSRPERKPSQLLPYYDF
jgi:pyrimidine nucleoside transport protein